MIHSEDKPLLSICITRYNENIYNLLDELSSQTKKLRSTIEIIVRDDCSQNYEEYKDFTHVKQFQNTKNCGRAKNRNLLSHDARGLWILFIDGDCLPVNKNYISTYLKCIDDNLDSVYIGGTHYEEPEYCNYHALYGRKYESKDKAASLKSNNFMISTELIRSLSFKEDIDGYGHEDSVLGIDLLRNGKSIVQIDNKVTHKGIVKNEEFIKNQEAALHNLIKLEKIGYDNISKIQRHYNSHNSIDKFKLFLTGILTTPFLHLRNQLVIEKPTFCLPVESIQLYKLAYYYHLKSTQKN